MGPWRRTGARDARELPHGCALRRHAAVDRPMRRKTTAWHLRCVRTRMASMDRCPPCPQRRRRCRLAATAIALPDQPIRLAARRKWFRQSFSLSIPRACHDSAVFPRDHGADLSLGGLENSGVTWTRQIAGDTPSRVYRCREPEASPVHPTMSPRSSSAVFRRFLGEARGRAVKRQARRRAPVRSGAPPERTPRR